MIAILEKDVNRTDRVLPYYSGSNNEKLQQLQDILMTYMMYNFNLGQSNSISCLKLVSIIQLDGKDHWLNAAIISPSLSLLPSLSPSLPTSLHPSLPLSVLPSYLSPPFLSTSPPLPPSSPPSLRPSLYLSTLHLIGDANLALS